MDHFRSHFTSLPNDLFVDNRHGLLLKKKNHEPKKALGMTKATSSTHLQQVETEETKKTK